MAWGLVGVIGFSFTVPMTRIAVDSTAGAGGLSPLFAGSARAVVAAVFAAGLLAATGAPRPSRAQWIRLAAVGGGIVVGFPNLTSFALTRTEATHGAVIIAALPAATAIAVTLRTRELQPTRFWALAALGAAAAIGFAAVQGGSVGGFGWPDLLLLAAVVVAAIGYAEGGLLSREIGAWQTTCWALIVAVPVTMSLTALSLLSGPPDASAGQWCALGYLALISMLLAFFAWYRGLALGPMAVVSQIQLIQPVLAIGWAALLLGERITIVTGLGGAVVVVLASLAVRARATPPAPASPRAANQPPRVATRR